MERATLDFCKGVVEKAADLEDVVGEGNQGTKRKGEKKDGEGRSKNKKIVKTDSEIAVKSEEKNDGETSLIPPQSLEQGGRSDDGGIKKEVDSVAMHNDVDDLSDGGILQETMVGNAFGGEDYDECQGAEEEDYDECGERKIMTSVEIIELLERLIGCNTYGTISMEVCSVEKTSKNDNVKK